MISPQIAPFMQNKPNFQKAQMNVSDYITREYEKEDTWWSGKNKPNSNPIQTQSNPIKANKMPKQTQYKPKTNPIYRVVASGEVGFEAVKNVVIRPYCHKRTLPSYRRIRLKLSSRRYYIEEKK